MKTKSVIMGIASNNAQGIDVKIDIPENLIVFVNKIIGTGHFISRFEMSSKQINDADEDINLILAEENAHLDQERAKFEACLKTLEIIP